MKKSYLKKTKFNLTRNEEHKKNTIFFIFIFNLTELGANNNKILS